MASPISLVLFAVLAALLAMAAVPRPVLALDLNRAEQDAVYSVLERVSPGIPWRTVFPDDLCSSAPHGVVCDYFPDPPSSEAVVPHVVELSFGYVSDYSPNPPCGENPNFDPFLLAPLPHLKKLFFYNCFTGPQSFTFPNFSPLSSLEELVFIENPSLVGEIGGRIGKLVNLRRLVLTGSGVSGAINPGAFHDLVNLEQITLSQNRFKGGIMESTFHPNMKKLRILDLSYNGFQGTVPDSIGSLSELLKLDLSHNAFSGRIPETLTGLISLEFLDLSYNSFGSYGVPLFLSKIPSLKEVYLSGNLLGGQIPEIWENLGGIRGIGLSGLGLVGDIPKSMGLHLRSACYIGLDNNRLQGMVPEEFGGLGFLNELNLENNNLSGRLPFSVGFVSRIGGKLKVEGNMGICIDEGLRSASCSSKVSGGGGGGGCLLQQLKICRKPDIPKTALFHESSCQGLPAAMFSWQLMGILLFGYLADGLFHFSFPMRVD